MRWGKLIIFLVLGGAIVGANLLFKDKLAERGLEAALQAAFGARAEVDGLHLRLLGGRVSFQHLAVADKDAPMTNLFELGPTGAALDVGQLLRRKVVIQSVACTDIRWATARAASGALPATAAATTASPAKGGGLSLPSLDSLGFDPAALLAREKAQLKSFAAFEQTDASLKQAGERWQARSDSLAQKTDKLGESVATLQKIDFRSIKSLDEARKAYKAVDEAAPLVTDLQKELKSASSDFQRDAGGLRAQVNLANGLLEEDVRTIRSRVALPEGGLKGAVSGLARGAVEQKLGRFSSLAFRALDAAVKLRESDAQTKKPRPTRRAGRDVAFPTTTYPSFLLQSFAFSVKPEGATLQGELRDLSSNPELWGRPASFQAGYRAGGRSIDARGELDTREASTRARIEASGTGMDFGLRGLPWIDTASGTYAFQTTADVERAAVSGKALVTTTAVSAGETRDLVGRVVRDAITQAKEIRLDIDFRASGSDFSMNLRTNLDDQVGRQLGSRLAELKADYQRQAEAELRKAAGPELAGVQQRLASLDASGGRLGALGGRTDGYGKQIDAKKAEYADALKRLSGGLKLPGL